MSKTEQPIFTLNKISEERTSKIEMIKNLIFGDEIQEYNSEFEKLRQDILEKRKVLKDLIEEVRTELDGAITDVSTDVNIRISELEERIENKIEDVQAGAIDKEALGKLFIDLGKKLSK